MSSQPQSKRSALDENPLGKCLRALRQARGLPLRVVAAEAEMDTALLSKIELGRRLPTEKQIAALASFFRVPSPELAARRIAEKFWMEHDKSEGATRAAGLITRTARQRHGSTARHG